MTGLLIQGLINGLILGAIYGLIGVGLNVVFGVLRVVNFAHGEFLVLGAYFAFYLMEYAGINPLVALPLAFVAFFLAGYLLYFVLIPRLSKADDPEISSLLLMFGVSIMLGALMLLAFDADARSLPYEIEPVFLKFGPVLIPTVRLLALAIALAIIAALTVFLYRTQLGKALRAIIMNRDAVRIVGINAERLSAVAFGLGVGLAAASGVLVAMVFPAFSPFMGNDYTLIGFIVIVLGGLGHPVGALVGALLFGITEQVSVVFFSPSIATICGFALMVATIFIRPSGLFGRQALR
ncbi:branched-chain amino acid ABC transporter permease [Achromobacter marplatensis]|jgi:branched-chain amino acid transport system permease protein|uniref:Amino acid/amide ABC transporter membrane protein 1 (HAAT family) n=1 Tax=Achromobacter marplatensis TaxID=470868 RepID=A0ABX9FWF9_9BURK|nr:branched-chain amino acid ABC transporter permease [Achromobacter marplatensis]OWT55777.1 branched-chain amino acid ABC transporter permease [Achromobacter marplatensis]RBP11467.1 amino acid/amide ABC transporter membrane protein 1 (HAAT family) [Achromobacter marplatensis]CAB3711338.1 High-affinity branched-chain amino acid transport system permease protein LivH [Achromobacter marplatensis]